MYEFEDDGVDVTHRKYYSIGGSMVAKREWVNQSGATTSYLASDHLSSTSIVMDSSDTKIPSFSKETGDFNYSIK